MSENIQYGLLTFPDSSEQSNLGDDIQAIAAKKFLPRVDVYLNRENLHVYDGQPTLVIMNGWFMHKPENFPPSERIVPIFESFHVSNSISEVFFTKNVLNYLRKFAPIGCRDMHTVNLLRNKGIDAYFSGCLTLTLEKGDFLKDSHDETVVFVTSKN